MAVEIIEEPSEKRSRERMLVDLGKKRVKLTTEFYDSLKAEGSHRQVLESAEITLGQAKVRELVQLLWDWLGETPR